MQPSKLTTKQTAKTLQGLLETGQFDSALPVIEDYGSRLIEAAKNAPTPAERIAILQAAADDLREHLHLVRIMRAHVYTQLTLTQRVASYQNAPQLESSWNLEG